ncbi:MAG TPA: enoyl-CoA hydratase-related protein [Actinomycetota bacterium]|nr:enoyl-CoA hydratase-related protein [Actinomycetota bacterium]
MGEAVTYELEDGVVWLVIDRPEARNAINQAVSDGLWAGFRRFEEDPGAAVLVLTGAGEAFCAGADLKEMAALGLTVPPRDMAPNLGQNLRVTKPVIAAVNGPAFGGGFLLAQMCDLCVAGTSARFAVTEARWGRGAPWAAPLPWLVPPRVAMELLLTGEPIDAQRAYEVGLVNRVVPDPELRSEAGRLARRIAGNAPLSVRAAKALVHATAGRDLREAVEEGWRLFEPVYLSEDAQEGPRAFVERRPPVWKGR